VVSAVINYLTHRLPIHYAGQSLFIWLRNSAVSGSKQRLLLQRFGT